ncbi:MAG: PAS domain-containing protein [Hydrogenophaga sp.]|uniref:PAS domain-containing protein n=1 Tax=Hydrogenophaga sp. TaxID=1904254 RepID=UPI001DBA5624|nr:PAS domain-containing protein [Hydrogenophaga sp.]MBX3608722.1 PAS domain-containing protein [Hydrogenophaga sp.]
MSARSETQTGQVIGTAPSLPFGLLFAHLPTACVVSRLGDGCILAVNDAWCALTGFTREAAIGQTTVSLGIWRDADQREGFLKGDHDADRLYPLRAATADHRKVRLKTEVLNVDGTELLLTCITEAQSEAVTQQNLQRALDELVEANRELQARNELHGEMELLAQLGAWTNREGSDTVRWSEGLYAVTGRTPGQPMDKQRARGGIHPDDREAWLAHRAALDGSFMDFRWIRPDGQQLWMRTRMSRSQVPGNPYTDFGVVQDVTAERTARARLQSQLDLLNQVAQHAPGMMYQALRNVDGSTEITFMSDRARDMLQLGAHESITDARTLFKRVAPDDLPRMLEDLDHFSRTLQPWRERYRVHLPDGAERWIRFEATPDALPDGRVLWHGFLADVTEERAARQALDRQQQLLEAIRIIQGLYIRTENKGEVFPRLLREIAGVARPDAAFLVELESAALGADPTTPALVGQLLDTQDREGRFTLDDPVALAQLTSGRCAVLKPDHAGHAALSAHLVGHHPLVLVPLKGPDGLVGLLGLQHRDPANVMFEMGFLEPMTSATAQLLLAWRSARQRDLTLEELAQTSRELEAQRRALQVTLQSMNQGLGKIEPDGRVSFYNQRLLELLDLPESLMQASPTHADVSRFMAARGDFGPGFEYVDATARHYVKVAGDSEAPGTYLRETQNGRFLEIGTQPLPEGGWVRTITDVSSYVASQQALDQERQRLAWVLEATRPGVWENDLGSERLTVNDRWAQIVGYTLQELEPVTDQTWIRLVHPDDLLKANAVRDAHIAGELPYYECDIRMRHKDGHWVWVNTRGRVHRRARDGKPLYMSGTHIDISERVQAQEMLSSLNTELERKVQERTRHLERTLRDMEAIAYSIAHDLRTPLRSVNGFASVLVATEPHHLSAAGVDSLNRIVNASKRMGQMLTEMLDVLAVVRADIAEAHVDMHTMAHDIDQQLGLRASQVALTIDPLPPARGDHKLIKQALRNLMDNAAKYSRHQQPPRVHVGYDAAERAYFVRDNGMGFDMAQADKLFGLFQRLHGDTQVPGTGIGLAIASRAVERHGGQIWARSAPGDGATFWMRLPSNDGA